MLEDPGESGAKLDLLCLFSAKDSLVSDYFNASEAGKSCHLKSIYGIALTFGTVS
jgi:hypothetical protein